MLFGELLFSDLFSFLKFLLKLLKSRGSGFSLGLFKSELDGVGVLRGRGDVVDWDLKCDWLWRIHHGVLCLVGCESKVFFIFNNF